MRSNLPDVVQTTLKNVCESIQSARPLLQQNPSGIEVSSCLCREFIGFRFAHKISFFSSQTIYCILKEENDDRPSEDKAKFFDHNSLFDSTKPLINWSALDIDVWH